MIAGRFFITPHAVNQYRKRYAPGLTYEQALAELIRVTETASYKHETHNGSQLWREKDKKRGLRMIVKPTDRLPMVVTVLPSFRRIDAKGPLRLRNQPDRS